MPTMTCRYSGCGQSLHVAPNLTGPVILPPCSSCGRVNTWPPTAAPKQTRPFLENSRSPTTPAPTAQDKIEKPCPKCAQPLRLPAYRSGQAKCPRPNCRHEFFWNPFEVGQEVIGIEAECSLLTDDNQYFTAIFQRPKGTTGPYVFHEAQKGTGGMDRTAGGNNYDELAQHGQIDYNRNKQNLNVHQLQVGSFRCPWCDSANLIFCYCGAVLCQGGLEENLITCPSCETTNNPEKSLPETSVKVRGAIYTPKKTALDNSARPALDQPPWRKRLGGNA